MKLNGTYVEINWVWGIFDLFRINQAQTKLDQSIYKKFHSHCNTINQFKLKNEKYTLYTGTCKENVRSEGLHRAEGYVNWNLCKPPIRVVWFCNLRRAIDVDNWKEWWRNKAIIRSYDRIIFSFFYCIVRLTNSKWEYSFITIQHTIH